MPNTLQKPRLAVDDRPHRGDVEDRQIPIERTNGVADGGRRHCGFPRRADGDPNAVGHVALRDGNVVAHRARVVVANPFHQQIGDHPDDDQPRFLRAGTNAFELAAERIHIREVHPRERGVDDGQVRHVHARDDQHADARAQHRVQQAVDLGTEHRHRIRHHVRADTAVGRWVFGFEPRRNRGNLRLRLCDAAAGLQPRDHLILRVLAPGLGERIDRERNPRHLEDRKPEALRHHADDRAHDAVDPHGCPHDLRGTAEALQPQLVAEQDHRIGPRPIVA